MRVPVLASILFVAAAAGATAGLMPRPVPLYDHTPPRAFVVLGPVEVASDTRFEGRSWAAHQAPALRAAAMSRYSNRPDALIETRHEPLPGGAGVRSTAIAVIWKP